MSATLPLIIMYCSEPHFHLLSTDLWQLLLITENPTLFLHKNKKEQSLHENAIDIQYFQ